MRLSQLGDELLARYAARGSERAFAALYERYHQPLYRYCRSIVRNDADAQDALQSAFTGALAGLRRGQRNAPLRPWLYRIAHNEAVSLLRRHKREADEAGTVEFAGAAASAEDEATGRARWRALIEDLTELPERQRGALLLRELSGLSHQEIAVVLGTSIGGAKQSIFEARRGLAELEEGRAMRCDEVRRLISDGDGRALRARRVRAHLSECVGCAAFADAVPARRSELRAFAPALPSTVAATLLARSLRAASPHGATGVASASTAAGVGAAGKAAGTALAWKAITAVAVVATAAVGATGLTHVLQAGRTGVRGSPSATHHARGAAVSGQAGPVSRATAQGAGLTRSGAAGSTPNSRANPAASGPGRHRGRSAGMASASPTASHRHGGHASSGHGHSLGVSSPGHKVALTPTHGGSSRSRRNTSHSTAGHRSSTSRGAASRTGHRLAPPALLRASGTGSARQLVRDLTQAP
jgi:RNA polymerase sigma factor (sigma-70 family)